MSSVTQRINEIKQPRVGTLNHHNLKLEHSMTEKHFLRTKTYTLLL